MGEPSRKMPAVEEWETAAAELDPFRYGWRPRYVLLPNGKLEEQQIPLTAEDLLDPQLGDVVTQSDPHFGLLLVLAELLRRYYSSRDDIFVSGDLKMLWGIRGLANPAPDIAVIPRVRRKHDSKRTSFNCKREGTRPCLVIEVVSSIDRETRRNDYDKKVEIYRRAGIPEYLILDPPTPATGERLLLTGYRLGADGRYRRIEPDSRGRLLSMTTGLLFGVAGDECTPQVFDASTGERIPTSDELAAARRASEEKARLSEEKALREAEARKAADVEIARLRAELERKDRR